MKANTNSPQNNPARAKGRRAKQAWQVVCVLLLAMLFAGSWAWAQSTPYLTVAPTGTNQILITITNATSGSYELWTTPILGDTGNYPWTVAAVGTNGQNSFTVPAGPYPSGFFQALLDTNAIPLWQAANPTNQSLGVLAVTIDSPTNGASLQ